ncbi:MAG: GDSL-type esterase/lipase family protein [Streptococcaceae bacterium]|nr:GDSL-type esterase/lipase family protein [Streptococcaceae bacterium]
MTPDQASNRPKSGDLTYDNPQIRAFQDKLRVDYDTANQTAKKGQIVFVGSSLMEIFPIEKWEEAGDVTFDPYIYNRGVRATTTTDLLAHLDTQVFDLAPTKVFINIGSNDIGLKVPEETFLGNYETILKVIREKIPACAIYVMAYYPVGAAETFDGRTTQDMNAASSKVEALVKRLNDVNTRFINVNANLEDPDGNLKAVLTFDGAHMNPDGYKVVLENLKEYL